MRRIEWLVVLSLFVAAQASAAPQGAAQEAAGGREETTAKQPFLGGFLQETRIVYPLQLDGWQARGEQLFDEAAMGAVVRYRQDQRTDRWIDLYFYPAGQLPAEDFEAAARRTVAEIEAAAVQSTDRKDLGIEPLQAFAIVGGKDSGPGAPASLQARSLALAFEMRGVAFSSAMAMTVHDLYFVKVRYSVEAQAASPDQARQLVEAFLGGIVRSTRIVSTGGCWRPLPFTTLAAGAAPPTDASGTLDIDGRPAAYVYPDHVAAYDPEGPAARLAMRVAMREQGQWLAGCEAPDRMNPEVGADQRELRLEYHAPSQRNADPARRIRLKRAGVG